MPTWEGLLFQRRTAARKPHPSVSWGFRKPRLSVSWGFRKTNLSVSWGLRLSAVRTLALILVVSSAYLAIDQQGPRAALTERQVSSMVMVSRNPSNGLSEAIRDVRPNFRAAIATPQKASTAAKFVVSFGRYRDQATAEAQAREVRSKGYTALVTREGDKFLVIGRVHQSRSAATHWSQVYRGIGLQAAVLPWVKRGS